MAIQKRGGPKAKLIKKALQEQLGMRDPDVFYEPINGPCMEMQGHAGGWYYIDDEWGEDCLGYTYQDALDLIGLMARNRGLI